MKKIINKLFFAVSIFAAVFAVSCNSFGDTDEGDSVKDTSKSYITLSVNDNNGRTALPDIPTSEFTYLKLTGNKIPAEGESVASGSVTSIGGGNGISWASYSEMTSVNTKIALSEGNWNFYLEASVKQGTKVHATYKGVVLNKEIVGGENPLAFTLSLDELNTSDGGYGNLEIKINLDSAAAAKVTAVAGRLLNSNGTVYEPTTGTYDTFRLLSKTTDDSGTSYTYTYPSQLQGIFVAQFRFYADEIPSTTEYADIDISSLEVPIATWRDAVNINSYGAKDEINLTADDFDKTYNITYLQRINFAAEDSINALYEATNSNTNIYSRRSAITLVAPEKTNYTFYRWVEVLPVTGGTGYVWLTGSDSVSRAAENGVTTEIVAGTIGDKYFCAEFIDENASKVIDHVTITADGTDGIVSDKVRVGHILTATPYTETTESDETIFPGTVTWFWYVDNTLVKTDTTYTETGLSAYETYEKLPTVTDGETTTVRLAKNQIMIPSSWYGKTVKVKALQNYIVSTDTNGKVTNIKENLTLYNANNSDTTVVFKEKSHEVTSGVLTVNAGESNEVKLSTGSLVSLIGTEIDSTKLTFTSGILSDVQSGWDIAKNGAQSRVTLTAVKATVDSETGEWTPVKENNADVLLAAPETSGVKDILVKFEVEGYETLYAKITNVPVSVKAKRPLATEFSFKDAEVVTKGKIRFNNYEASGVDTTETYTLGSETPTVASTVTRTSGEKTLEYSFVAPDTATAGDWQAWKTTEDAQRYDDTTSPEIETGNNTSIWVRVKATTGIAASDAVEISLDGHIGTLVRLASVELNYENKAISTHSGARAPEVGTTISVKLLDAAGAENTVTVNPNATDTIGGYTYLWKVIDTHNANAVLTTGSDATFDITNGSWVGKALSVTVTPTYIVNSRTGADSVEPTTGTTASEKSTSETIVTGQLNITDTVEKLAYVNASAVAVKELPGATPSAANLRMVNGSEVSEVVESLAKNYLSTSTSVPVTFAFVNNVPTANPVRVRVRPSVSAEGAVIDTSVSPNTRLTATDGSQAAIQVKISATGYYDEIIDFAIPVDTEAAQTLLRTDVRTLPIGHIAFKSANPALEYWGVNVSTGEGEWKSVETSPFNKAGEYDSAESSNNVINVSAYAVNSKFYTAGETVKARYADDTEIEFPLRLTSAYIGTHGAIVSISIDETAPGLTVVGNVVTAPSGGSNYTWTIDGTSADSAQVSGNTYTVSVDYTTDYDIAVEYKDSTGSWQNARATVRVTASN